MSRGRSTKCRFRHLQPSIVLDTCLIVNLRASIIMFIYDFGHPLDVYKKSKIILSNSELAVFKQFLFLFTDVKIGNTMYSDR